MLSCVYLDCLSPLGQRLTDIQCTKSSASEPRLLDQQVISFPKLPRSSGITPMHPDLPTSGGHLSHMFSGVGLPSSKLAAFPSTLKFTFRDGETKS